MKDLVFNRTMADVEKRRNVKAKLIQGVASDEDYQYWLRGEAVPLSDSNGEQIRLADGDQVKGREGFLRGAYNFVDLNRVGEWVKWLHDRFHELPLLVDAYRVNHLIAPDPIYLLPYDEKTVIVDPKLDWVMEETPSQAEVERYLSDLRLLRSVIALPADTPAVPADLSRMIIGEANDIEKLLLIIDTAITALHAYKDSLVDRAVLSLIYSGETFTEEGLY